MIFCIKTIDVQCTYGNIQLATEQNKLTTD
nr:MAG TPA: hypothetical protein [Caudoviricetes sp.]